jgi:hypothetical protein
MTPGLFSLSGPSYYYKKIYISVLPVSGHVVLYTKAGTKKARQHLQRTPPQTDLKLETKWHFLLLPPELRHI